ncbi:MAG: hypothetical protein JWM74_1609 [Myxococcaceae bacterium]|nr:hypothetical protein [Myxococcaceae bacterium]
MKVAAFCALSLVVACGARTDLILDDGIDEVDVVDASIPRDASTDARVRDASEDAPSPRDAGLDVAKPSSRCDIADAGSPPFPTACGHSLRVLSLKPSSATCFLDLAISQGSVGAMTVFCNGGYASADFGKGTFQGTFDQGAVSMCIGTTFTYSDGCTWQTAQRISGTLASGTLAFEYAEAPIKGTNCASPCSATGTIEVK